VDLSVSAALDRVDWNFSGSATPGTSIHSLHSFPGNFIPQIPAYLIQLLSEPGDTVLDPFCGSGTTAIEAALLGRRSWMSDINTASLQVTRGKVAVLRSADNLRDLRILASGLVWEGILVSDELGQNGDWVRMAKGAISNSSTGSTRIRSRSFASSGS
jgi:hypothetical protein